jgi:hypothetical protein
VIKSASFPVSPAPPDPALEIEDPDDPIEEAPWLENPVLGAEELLRFSGGRQLLLS